MGEGASVARFVAVAESDFWDRGAVIAAEFGGDMATLDLSRDIDRLRGEMDALRRDIASHSRSARDIGLARGHDALERAEVFGKRARKRVMRAEKQLSRNVEKRPIIAVLAAIGFGFLIAKLLDLGLSDRH
jgi:hypothetical protein